MPGHINDHSIALYNKAVQLDRMGSPAIRYFRKSANLGNIKAMLRMGIAYAIGDDKLGTIGAGSMISAGLGMIAGTVKHLIDIWALWIYR